MSQQRTTLNIYTAVAVTDNAEVAKFFFRKTQERNERNTKNNNTKADV